MTGRPKQARRATALLALVVGLLLVPGAAREQPSMSLVRLESASAVDVGDGVVWILAIGSDVDSGQDLMTGNADAIQLVGLDVEAGRAVAIGIPRDSWVDIPDEGLDRINQGLRLGGPQLMARLVEDLTRIEPQYVVTSGPQLFAEMVDAIGGLTVRSRFAFEDPESELVVQRGPNRFDGEEAAAFAGAREPLPASDFDRSVNQQALLRAILERVRTREDRPGFLETGALAAFAGLEAENLGPSDIFRFAHAITEIDPARVDTCVIGGRPLTTSGGASVIIPDREQARRVARDAAADAQLDRGCG